MQRGSIAQEARPITASTIASLSAWLQRHTPIPAQAGATFAVDVMPGWQFQILNGKVQNVLDFMLSAGHFFDFIDHTHPGFQPDICRKVDRLLGTMQSNRKTMKGR